MDCETFTSLLEDLERDTPMLSGLRGAALQHAENCAYCRARLADARLLSLGLRALARDDEKLQAPPRVEAMLVAAFREQGQRSARLWRSLSWAGVVAALAVAGWLTVARPWRQAAPTSRARVQAARSQPAPKARSVETASSSAAPKTVSAKSSAKSARSRPTSIPAATEVAGEFIALSPADSAYPVGEGMVVRVELPRSAPALVGLPIGESDMSGTVTADVVLGQDGVARAIRFVQPGAGQAANQNLDFKQN